MGPFQEPARVVGSGGDVQPPAPGKMLPDGPNVGILFLWNPSRILWVGHDVGSPFGPYVDRDHCAGLMEMVILKHGPWWIRLGAAITSSGLLTHSFVDFSLDPEQEIAHTKLLTFERKSRVRKAFFRVVTERPKTGSSLGSLPGSRAEGQQDCELSGFDLG